jgi:hypothetical protein
LPRLLAWITATERPSLEGVDAAERERLIPGAIRG